MTGRAMGFLPNPELPLELGMQIHRQLGPHNARLMPEDRINARIGLGSGPAFIERQTPTTTRTCGDRG